MTSTLTTSSLKNSSSHITKTYRQASTLFLTRRLPESLSTLLPVLISTPGFSEPSLISSARKTTRIKVWSLYLAILNAICELGPDEGKQTFGTNEFSLLVSKVRDGTVWEEVVKNGYGGLEANVDTDVVINLATLLLAQARNQKLNQACLERYLASKTNPILDQVQIVQSRSHAPRNGGTDTPRDLNALVKILELYCLHVLLRNNEWDYAQECITLSSILDEERREAFLQALHILKDEQAEIESREKVERLYREENLRRSAEAAKQNREIEQKREEEERMKREHSMEGSKDNYGFEDKSNPRAVSRSPALSKAYISKKSSLHSSSPSAKAAAPAKKTPPSLIHRIIIINNNICTLLESVAASLKMKPLVPLKLVTFVLGILFLLGRKEIKFIIMKSWTKVRQTVTMGGKVTYI